MTTHKQRHNENFEYFQNNAFFIHSYPMNDVTLNIKFLQQQITVLTTHIEHINELPATHPSRQSGNVHCLLFELNIQKQYVQWVHDSYVHFDQRMTGPARAATIPLLELPSESLSYILDHLHPHDLHRLCIALVGITDERYQVNKTLILEEYALVQRSTVNRWCTECYHCLSNTQVTPAPWNRPSSARETRRWDADAPSPQTQHSLQNYFAFQYYEGQERIAFRRQIDGTFQDVIARVNAFRVAHGAQDPATVRPPTFNYIQPTIPEVPLPDNETPN